MRHVLSNQLVPCLLVIVGTAAALAQAPDDERTAIEAAITAYVDAFNSQDAKTLADFWSPEGVYTSRLSGEQIVGRDALQAEFAALFDEIADAKLEVATQSIDFVSPNVALEVGQATVIRPDHEPAKSSYQVVYVKRDDKWLIDRISEKDELPPAPSHYEQLKDLEWMVGDWKDQEGETSIKTHCQWTRNRNFLLRTFTASTVDDIDITGMQFVGWDPARKQIRSWVFDSDGGFAEAVWTQSDKRWQVKTKATLPDGRVGSSTTILRPLDDDRFGWQKVNRIVDGEILPNIDEVVIVRQAAQ